MRQNSLYRSASSLYRLKVTYQRNMLIGLVVAALVVIIPTVLWAYWPNEKPIVIDRDDPPPDTIFVDMTFDKDYTVIKEDVGTGSSGPKVDGAGATGLFVEHVKIYEDGSEYEPSNEGFAGNVGDGESEIDDIFSGSFGNGTGGLLIEEDNRSYLITDSLDRIPEIVFIPDPVYPPLAQKTEVEGIVLLEVLVGIEGEAKEVKIKSESNPGHGFGQKAVDAASQASFLPALRGNAPVNCWVSFTVKFEVK